MAGLFLVVTVQLVFAEIHGTDNFHHHRSEIVDGPTRSPDQTASSPKDKVHVHTTKDTAKNQGDFLRVALLEMGILFHSVFIGRSPRRPRSCVVELTYHRNGLKCIKGTSLCRTFYCYRISS